jgi:uncharacterized protein (DUF433 family)
VPRIEIIDRGRGPELAGTRITVFDIIPYLEAGHTPNYIAAVLNLATDEVLALMRYLEDHKAEVLETNKKIVARIAQGNSPEIETILQASPWHARIQARLAAVLAKPAGEANGASDPR